MSIARKKLSIVVVNFNSTKKLLKLIESLKYITEIIDEVIVIDNNSDDFSKTKILSYEKVKLIINKSNVGFAKAVNQGISLSKNRYLLLLNPDCEIVDNSPLKTFRKITSNNKIGAIGGQIVNTESGDIQYSATSEPGFMTGLFEFTNLKKLFSNNKYSKLFWLEKGNYFSVPTKVFSVCGAYMFINKRGLMGNNFLNESYFLYLEDLDFGYIIANNLQEVWFDPDSSVHHVGGSSSKSKYKIKLNEWYVSRKRFFLLHLPRTQGYILYIIFSV